MANWTWRASFSLAVGGRRQAKKGERGALILPFMRKLAPGRIGPGSQDHAPANSSKIVISRTIEH